jgi:hypothetical protein
MPQPINAPRTRVIRTCDDAFMPQFSCDSLSWFDLLDGPVFSREAAFAVAEQFLFNTGGDTTHGTPQKTPGGGSNRHQS